MMPSKGSIAKMMAEKLANTVRGADIPLASREFQAPVPHTRPGALSKAADFPTSIGPRETDQLEDPSKRAFLRQMAASTLNQAIPSPLKAAAKFISETQPTAKVAGAVPEWPKVGKFSMGESLSPNAMEILGEDEDGDLSYMLSELSPIVAKRLKSLGLFMDDDLGVHYDVDKFPEVDSFIETIRDAFDEGDSRLWKELQLQGDDDLDYNSGYPGAMMDAISTHLVDSHPELIEEFRAHPWLSRYISDEVE